MEVEKKGGGDNPIRIDKSGVSPVKREIDTDRFHELADGGRASPGQNSANAPQSTAPTDNAIISIDKAANPLAIQDAGSGGFHELADDGRASPGQKSANMPQNAAHMDNATISIDKAANPLAIQDAGSGGLRELTDGGRISGWNSAKLSRNAVSSPHRGDDFPGARYGIDHTALPGRVEDTADAFYLDTADTTSPFKIDMSDSKLLENSVDVMEYGDFLSVDAPMNTAKSLFTSQLRMDSPASFLSMPRIGRTDKTAAVVSVDAPIQKIGVEKIASETVSFGPSLLPAVHNEAFLSYSFELIQSGDIAGGMKTAISDLSGKAVKGLKAARITAKKELIKSATTILTPFLFMVLVLVCVIGAAGSVASTVSFFSLTAYPTDDTEITGSTFDATNYCEDLKEEVREIPSQPEWSHINEFNYIPSLGDILSDIDYDPWILQAYLNAKFPGYSTADVSAEISSIMAEMFVLNLSEHVEIRYDSDGDPYNYYILDISMTKTELETIVLGRMNADETEMYDVYMNDDLLGTHTGVGNPFTFDWRPYISCRYGWRENPTSPQAGGEFHTGLDLAVAGGTPIQSGIVGRVTTVTTSYPYGNRVEITSLDGQITVLYAHMQSISVTMGQPVIVGATEIGKVGTTGNSTGNHLHIEIFLNGQRIDPLFVLGHAS